MGPEQFDLRALLAQRQINDALGVRPQTPQQVDPRLAAINQMQQGGMRPPAQQRPMPQAAPQQPNLQALLAMLQQRQAPAQPMQNPLAALAARYQPR